MTKNSNIHILYKKLGETPRECLDKYKKEYILSQVVSGFSGRLSMTYAGRLDPMAEGLLLVLSGDEISQKEKYIDLSKEYEFEILWECSTDTGDILGLAEADLLSVYPSEMDVRHYVEKNVGNFTQKYPAFSSQTASGQDENGQTVNRALIEWARLGQLSKIVIPSHEVAVTSAEYLSRKFLTGAELQNEIGRRVTLVNGDFRQENILFSWRKIFDGARERQFAIDTVKLNVSSGFYVRQYVMDMAQALSVPATTFHILRKRVGDFELN